MNIIAFILVGLVAGWLAGLIVDDRGFGFFGDVIVGIIGAFVGGYLLDVLGITVYGFLGVLAMSVIGAVTFLLIVGLIVGPRNYRNT